MKNRLPLLLAYAWACMAFCSLSGQIIAQNRPAGLYDTLRIADYNLLNYPGTDAATRNPYFRRIVQTMKPDILVVEEMTSQAGVTGFLNNVMNYFVPGLYSTIPFHNGGDTNPGIFLRSDKVTFVNVSYIPTDLRDVGEYTVAINGTLDTLRIYAVHLKASQGFEQQRLTEATILRNYLNALPPGTQFLVVGDYNFYTADEPGMQKFIENEADNDGRCKDPLNAVGQWQDNPAYASIHTQSTRKRSFGGGATGGLDDRFDLILTSYSSLDDNILTSTYTSYGNDGLHLNDSINRLPNFAVPDSVANALHYASDHIPVFCDFQFLRFVAGPPQPFALLTPADNAANQATAGTLTWESSPRATAYDVYLDQSDPPTTLVSSGQPGTSYLYGGLANELPYHWKVVARNDSGTLDAIGSPRLFRTIVAAPGAFDLLTPTGGALHQPQSGLLTWSASPHAASYDVYLAVVNPPAVRIDSNRTDTVYAYSGLQLGTAYYWNVVARNVAGFAPAGNTPLTFSTVNVPASPSQVSVNGISTSSITLSWLDNADDESGYRVYRSADSSVFSQAGGDLPPNSMTFVDTGLGINTRHYYRVVAFNGNGESNFASYRVATAAAIPGSPTVNSSGYTALHVSIDPGANPVVTQFAIRVNDGEALHYLRTDGSLGPESRWGTYMEWGGPGGLTVPGLKSCTNYTIAVDARNLDSLPTPFGPDVVRATNCFTFASTVDPGWNLLSLPLNVVDPRPVSVFPGVASGVFVYENGYQIRDSLYAGPGYWAKFNAVVPVNFGGEPRLSDSLLIRTGWNIVGALSVPTAVSGLTTRPPGILSPTLYDYDGMYHAADSLKPLKGYWVKASGPGTLFISSSLQRVASVVHRAPESKGVRGLLTVEDALGYRQELSILLLDQEPDHALCDGYELPPLPPTGGRDVRFRNGSSAMLLEQRASTASMPIEMMGMKAPVTLRWTLPSSLSSVVSIVDGKEVVRPGESGRMTLTSSSPSLSIKIGSGGQGFVPKAFALYQNFPNPFNPSTTISFDLPVFSLVRLTVENVLGEEVALLLQGSQEAGRHEMVWTPNLASGVYFCKIEVTGRGEAGISNRSVKKMILTK